MRSIIIGIHGLGNKPPEGVLKQWWVNSIQEGLYRYDRGLLKIPMDLVYWADVIHPQPLDPAVDDPRNPLFLEEHYTPGRGRTAVSSSGFYKEMVGYLENQMDRIFLNDDLSINFKKVTDHLIHHFFSDLGIYYKEQCEPAAEEDCVPRKKIQGRLIDKLEKYKGYRIMLIAHSMGSIIAYDVLSELEGRLPIHTFLTIGSPLGLPVIVARVQEARKRRGHLRSRPPVPEGISDRWINMSDIRDRVAFDHTLRDDYLPNSRGLEVDDQLVHNDYEMNGKSNPHKSFGYLRTPEIVEVVSLFRDQEDSTAHHRFWSVAGRFLAGLKAAAGKFHPRKRLGS